MAGRRYPPKPVQSPFSLRFVAYHLKLCLPRERYEYGRRNHGTTVVSHAVL